jgi:hypothetical protein
MRETDLLKLLLRVVGSASLLAIFAVVIPYDWMDWTHRWLGMGELPDAPIVGYLARSTSAFYAILGGLLWLVSFDLPRHRTVLMYLGAALAILGVTLFVVDIAEGMPSFWTTVEGPADILFGAIFYYWGRRLPEPNRAPPPPVPPT